MKLSPEQVADLEKLEELRAAIGTEEIPRPVDQLDDHPVDVALRVMRRDHELLRQATLVHTPEAADFAAAVCRHWTPAEYGVDVADTVTGRAAQWLTTQAGLLRYQTDQTPTTTPWEVNAAQIHAALDIIGIARDNDVAAVLISTSSVTVVRVAEIDGKMFNSTQHIRVQGPVLIADEAE